ncbi:MAG: hypothetical protein FJ405_15285 [Verrucomicrobia bacterium]|nr:hypothetical protein [Verrucomicrobiota bacterium]
MKQHTLALLAGFTICLTSLNSAAADLKQELIDGIRKLEQASGYSWSYVPKVTGSESAGRSQAPFSGKTDKDGYALIQGKSGDTEVELATKGEKLVVNYNGGWISTAEIGEQNSTVKRLRLIKRPSEEARLLADKALGLKKGTDGAITTDLDGAWAKEIFSLLGRRAAAAPSAQGLARFFLKDGVLHKYEFTVRGKIRSRDDTQEVDLINTITVEIKDVGNTTLEIPEEAKQKL